MELGTEHTARFKIDKAEPDKFGISWWNYSVFERKHGWFGSHWKAVKNFYSLPDAQNYVKYLLELPEYYG